MTLPVAIIGKVGVYQSGNVLRYVAGLAVDADGANGQGGKLPAYAPKGSGIAHLDALGNAGEPGNWYGLVTDTGKPSGTPIVQSAADPCPGAYVSATAIRDPSKLERDPRAHVDAATVPYGVLPPELLKLGAHKGDLGRATYKGRSCPIIFADVGPHGKAGEGSVALAEALGIPSSPINGGVEALAVTWEIYLGSASTPAWPRELSEIASAVASLSSPQ